MVEVDWGFRRVCVYSRSQMHDANAEPSDLERYILHTIKGCAEIHGWPSHVAWT